MALLETRLAIECLITRTATLDRAQPPVEGAFASHLPPYHWGCFVCAHTDQRTLLEAACQRTEVHAPVHASAHAMAICPALATLTLFADAAIKTRAKRTTTATIY